MSKIHVAAIWREVKILRVIVEVVLLEELLQLLPRGELEAARAVDVDIPPTGLLPMLPLLEPPDPAGRQCLVAEFQYFGQVSRPFAVT